MPQESHHEQIMKLFAESANKYWRQHEAGDPDAHLKWAFTEAFLDTLKAGYLITDFSCFRKHPLYTGNHSKKELTEEPEAPLLVKHATAPEADTLTQELIAAELKNIRPSPLKRAVKQQIVPRRRN